jgi:hypothetical protein
MSFPFSHQFSKSLPVVVTAENEGVILNFIKEYITKKKPTM